jgi:hypothetical protein
METHPMKKGRRKAMNSWQDRFWFWLTVAAMAIVIWVFTRYGFWYATVVIGFAVALFVPSGGRSILIACFGGLVGWGIPLTLESLSTNLGGAASLVAGVMGLGSHSGTLLVIFTLIFGTALCLSGAWFGRSMRSMFLR